MRSNFTHSGLVSQLAEWMPAGTEAPRENFAERLAQWLTVADAITLHGAHRTIPSAPAVPPPGAGTVQGDVLQAELQRVRTTLTKSITADNIRLTDVSGEPDSDFSLYHQHCADQQRRMEMTVNALRGHTRKILSDNAPHLATLAALDAVLEEMLGGREQQVLSTVPAFLKKRFEQLRKASLNAAEETAATGRALPADNPGPTNAWLHTFGQEMQAALLAELEVRLQPVTGMVEALGQEMNL